MSLSNFVPEEAVTVEFLDMTPYGSASIASMANMIKNMITSGQYKSTDFTTKRSVMDHIKEQCRGLDKAIGSGGGSVPVTVDLDTLETILDDGQYVGSGPMSLEEIRKRIQGVGAHE